MNCVNCGIKTNVLVFLDTNNRKTIDGRCKACYEDSIRKDSLEPPVRPASGFTGKGRVSHSRMPSS